MSTRSWSPFQQAIFADVASGEGHTVILARAGSGKTTTIVAALDHVPTEYKRDVLFVAFNKAIADELKGRAPYGVTVSTLHSYGLRAVTRAFGRLQIDTHRVDDFASRLVHERLSSQGLKGKDLDRAVRETWEYRRNVAKCVSLAKGMLASDDAAIDSLIDAYGIDVNGDREQCVQDTLSILGLCTGTEDGRIDFDDMIWLPCVHGLRLQQYARVFVDETQDLNPAQIRLVLGSVKPGGRVCAVGDDRQAIYRFRGADENAVGRVIEALDAKVLPLSVTYRCARYIVTEVLDIVPDLEPAPNAIDGTILHRTRSECRKDAQPGDFILSRTNAPLIGLCLYFIADGRRAHIAGRDIGAQLSAFVKKSHAPNVEDLRTFVTGWGETERKRLQGCNPPRDTSAVDDRVDCLLTISDGASSVDEVLGRIERLFADDDDSARIVLSTTHKAKGLERDRVWLLADTYRRRPGVEEDNLYYVAVTRARRELVFVSGK